MIGTPGGPVPRRAVVGVAGPELDAHQRELFSARPPLGFILFARNCQSREQVRRLVRELRSSVGRADAPVLIDQEGGRVMRLRPPEWRPLPPAGRIGGLAARDPEAGAGAAFALGRLIALDLAELGIDVDCAPVLDVPGPGGHAVIGDRAFAGEPGLVAALGRAFIRGLEEGGVQPVIKHMPGHGRARADSHHELPAVDAGARELARDLAPFRALREAPFGMTAHIRYTAVDPDRPATQSRTVIEELIRGAIGFEGVLLTDDIGMRALQGGVGERTVRALEAGCDLVLHCNGDPDELAEVLRTALPLEGVVLERVRRARARLPSPRPLPGGLEARLAPLLAAEA
jgi:beta-N-acetylhexosaminidase